MATLEDRLRAKIQVDPSGCWLWQAAFFRDGYGMVWAGRRSPAGNPVPSRAHRAAYETWVGPIPEGLVIDHLCRTPACINPAHLEPVTVGTNVMRGQPKNRDKPFCKNGHEFTPDNTCTYALPTGRVRRYCKACHRRNHLARVEEDV